MISTFLSFILLFSFCLLTFGRNVFIEVKAPWSRYVTSPLVDVSEFIYQQPQSSHLFWNFLDTLCHDHYNGFDIETNQTSDNQSINDKDLLP